MHTTLDILKQAQACVPGFTRMVSFFSTHPSLKNMPIPIWMVGVVGCEDDLEWAMTNALIIDQEVFQRFYDYTFFFAAKCKFWHLNTSALRIPESSANKIALSLVKKMSDAKNAEEVKAVFKEFSVYHFDSALWNTFIHDPMWNNPKLYLEYIWNNMSSTITFSHKRIQMVNERHYYFPRNPAFDKVMNFAYLCCHGQDPYTQIVKLLMASKLGSRRGVQISPIEEDGKVKFAATINTTDPRKIFMLYHVMNGSDVDILNLTGVNKLSKTLDINFRDGSDLSEALINQNVSKTLLDLRSDYNNEPQVQAIVGETRIIPVEEDDDDAPANTLTSRRRTRLRTSERARTRPEPIDEDEAESEDAV